MLCDTCGQNEAAFMLGNMETGDQLALCPADFGRFGLGMALRVLPADELELQWANRPTPEPEPVEDGAAAEPRPRIHKSKARRRTPRPPATPALEETSASTTDG